MRISKLKKKPNLKVQSLSPHFDFLQQKVSFCQNMLNINRFMKKKTWILRLLTIRGPKIQNL